MSYPIYDLCHYFVELFCLLMTHWNITKKISIAGNKCSLEDNLLWISFLSYPITVPFKCENMHTEYLQEKK